MQQNVGGRRRGGNSYATTVGSKKSSGNQPDLFPEAGWRVLKGSGPDNKDKLFISTTGILHMYSTLKIMCSLYNNVNLGGLYKRLNDCYDSEHNSMFISNTLKVSVVYHVKIYLFILFYSSKVDEMNSRFLHNRLPWCLVSWWKEALKKLEKSANNGGVKARMCWWPELETWSTWRTCSCQWKAHTGALLGFLSTSEPSLLAQHSGTSHRSK